MPYSSCAWAARLIQISPHTSWDSIPFTSRLQPFPFFTTLLDFVFLLPLEINKLNSSGFLLIRFAHLFIILNSSLSSSFLNIKDPNHTQLRGKQTLNTISSTHWKAMSHHVTGEKQLKEKIKVFFWKQLFCPKTSS